MGGNVLSTTRSPTASSFVACELMTFLVADHNGAHRFRYFLAVLVEHFGRYVHDCQRPSFLVHDVAYSRSKSQSVADNHWGVIGEMLLTVQNTSKVDLQ